MKPEMDCCVSILIDVLLSEGATALAASSEVRQVTLRLTVTAPIAETLQSAGPLSAENITVTPTSPGAQFATIGGAGAQQDQSGAERGRDHVGHDRYPADGTRCAVREPWSPEMVVESVISVAFSGCGGEVLKVTRAGCAAEDDLHNAGVPPRRPRYPTTSPPPARGIAAPASS